LNVPTRICKLILCDTAARITTAELWDARIATVKNGGIEAIIPAMMERCFTPTFRQLRADVIARTRSMVEGSDPAGYIACCYALRDADNREAVAGINVSTLVISGTHDPVTPPSDGRFLADAIAGATFVELDASHLSNIEAEKGFNSVMLKFLLG